MAPSEWICGRCGHEFCAECVVFPRGLEKPPLCIPCALEAGGVRRQHTGRPRLADKEIKRRLALQRERRRSAAPPAPQPEPEHADQDKERWLEGADSAEDVGGWRKVF